MIDFDAFVEWANDRFNGDIIVKGKEVKINSIFAEDTKHHLWCNPFGGTKHREDGVYRCFYTEKRGTLVGLIMKVDNCSLQDARDILEGRTPIHELEAKLEEMFRQSNDEPPQQDKLVGIELPEFTFQINAMHSESPDRQTAESYLAGRKLPTDSLYYCTAGKFRNRIIIPYFDRERKLIYYNGRAINDSFLRYMGPDKSIGVGKADVLYFREWPKPGSKIHLTEGEFDAMVLNLCGFYGCACGGKTLSDKQVIMLRDYKVCISLDTDKAGRAGLAEMGDKLRGNGVNTISFVRPPRGWKDWNALYMDVGKDVLAAYVKMAEKEFDIWASDMLEITSV